MWSRIRMEKTSWIDRVRGEQYTEGRLVALARSCVGTNLLKHIIEGKIEGRI
jgi:hypothetical protein